jgi:hypothetical protein
LAALGRIDTANEYFVFTNLEMEADLVPRQPNFQWKPQALRARSTSGSDSMEANCLATRSFAIQDRRAVQSGLHRAHFLRPARA